MKITLPGYLEVEPHAFKTTVECNYAEFLAARKRETDYLRRKQLDRLLRINGATWKSFPLLTVEDMIER